MQGIEPIVSIMCFTYNHEKYIRQCLDGILLQKTDYPYEIIIHDDASSDSTIAILQEYVQKFPNVIFPIFQQTNQWSQGIDPLSTYVLPRCKGVFLAFCDGDDYWTDPLKLQKHVQFLKTHPDYILIHSDFINVDQNNKKTDSILYSIWRKFKKKKSGFITKHLIRANYIKTVTVLIVKDKLVEAENRIYENRNQIENIDFTKFIELSMLGKIHYDAQKTAAYRILPESASHSGDLSNRFKFITSTIDIARFYNNKYSIGFKPNYFNRLQLTAELKEYSNKRDPSRFIIKLCAGLKSDYHNIFRWRNFLFLLISFFPSKRENG